MLDKKYNHKEVEMNKYNNWVNKGYFKGDKDKSKEPFCIVIPPPNVTGKLHLGHAWNTTLQDIIIRYRECVGMMPYGFLELIMLVLPHKRKLIRDLEKWGLFLVV